MINVISKYNFKIPYKIRRINSIDEINSKLLIIDEEEIEFDKIKEKTLEIKNLHIIVISFDNIYSPIKLQKMFENNIDYIIDNDKLGFHLIPLLKMLEKKYKTIERVNINKALKQLTIGDDTIVLTKREAQIYEYLLKHRGKLCARQDILVDVLGYHKEADTRIVDVYIKHLRGKINASAQEIKTERGKGYILL